MTDQLISFETAKLAKEKEFNIPVNGVYVDNGTLSFARDNDETDYNWNERKGYSAPTQSLLQKWIRETHNIHIYIGRRTNVKKWDSHAYSFSLSAKEYLKKRTMENFHQQSLFDTYEEALEYGLQEALKLI